MGAINKLICGLVASMVWAAAIFVASPASAGGLSDSCAPFFRHGAVANHSYGYSHGYIANQQVYYRAAEYLREEAKAELIADKVVEKLEAKLEAKGFFNAGEVARAAAPTVMPLASKSILSSSCAKCHNATEDLSGKGVILDGSQEITPDVALWALNQVRKNKMPKGKPLAPEAKGKLMEELLDLEDAKRAAAEAAE